MNVAQVMRQALLEARVVRQNGTSSSLFTVGQLLAWANDCQRKMEAAWRKSGQDYNLVTRESDDGAFTYEQVTYNNSSYQLIADTRTYTLPPDLISLKRIRALTAAYREYVFTNLDVTSPVFRALENVDNPGGSEIYWDVIGGASTADGPTLRLSHPLASTCEIEIMYNARLPRLYTYALASGTAGFTLDSTALTFSAGTLLSDERLTLPAEIIFNSSGGNGTPQVISSTSTDDFIVPTARTGAGQGWPIESFDTDTTATLQATYPFATDSSNGYLIASAPAYLRDHWPIMVNYLVFKILKELRDSKGAGEAFNEYTAAKKEFDYDIHKRADEAAFVEDYNG